MRTIPLTKGMSACVDDQDYGYLTQWKWYAQSAGRTFYAARRQRLPNGKRALVLMHREVNKTPDGLLTDHIDGDGLNNTRANLRSATPRQNSMNTAPQIGRTSARKGVWHDPSSNISKHWRAAIRVNGKLKYLGRFTSEKEAAEAYARSAAEHFGEFSRPAQGESP